MITVKVFDQVTPTLKRISADMPKAASKGLNYIAYDSRDAFIKESFLDNFVLRKGWWKPGSPFGFNVAKSTPSNLTAIISTRAPWMMLHETGGNKLPQNKHIAIPTAQVRRTKRDLILKSQTPVGLGKRAFYLKTDEGDEVLAMNFGRGKSRITKVMYTLKSKTHIRPRLRFVKFVSDYAAKHSAGKMQKAMDDLLKSAAR